MTLHREIPHLGRVALPRSPTVAKCLKSYVKANLVAVTEAVDDGLGGGEDPHRDALKEMHFYFEIH